MKNRKRVILITLFAILVFVFFKHFFYEKEALKNVSNCEKIKLGMNMDQVIDIMGLPHLQKEYTGRVNYKETNILLFCYTAPSGSSSGVDVLFDAETKLVIMKQCKE